jgi:4-hydroxybenzoate polyprenyltransferase
MRPTQWVKNAFVLAPLFFGHALDEPRQVLRAVAATAAFCFAASAVYLFNDIRDREEDRRHPRKKHRPLAAGTLGVPLAIGAALVLALASSSLALVLGGKFALILGLYLAQNFLYSMGLKRVVILDVMILALGFVLRVLAGGAVIDVAVSSWLLLCTVFVALFLGFSKRRHEVHLLAGEAAEQRSVLSQYSASFLDQMINVVTASTVVAYALYAVAPETVEKYGSERLVWTVPLVLFGVFRYLYLTYQKVGKRNPTEAILTDPPFLINMVLWGLAVVWIVYG